MINLDKKYTIKTLGFDIINNIPIDKRFVIDNIVDVDTLIPIELRYEGLIVYDKSTKTFYIFDDTLTQIKLTENIFSQIKYRITVDKSEYSNLNVILNGFDEYFLEGMIINIQPLNIFVFKYNNIWNYLSGVYKFDDISEIDNLPINFKSAGAKAIQNSTNVNYIFDENLLLIEDKIIELTKKPVSVHNGWYYLINGILYKAKNNELFQLNSKFFTTTVFNIYNDYCTITHNLNTLDLRVKLRLIPLSYSTISKDIIIEPDLINVNKIGFKTKLKNINGILIIEGLS